MGQTRTLNHCGKDIIYNDFTNFHILSKDELWQAIEASKVIISKQPLHSALILTNFTGLRFDIEMIHRFSDYVSVNKPYVKASALIGIEGLKKIAVNSVKTISGRHDLQLFDDEKEALDWLVSQ